MSYLIVKLRAFANSAACMLPYISQAQLQSSIFNFLRTQPDPSYVILELTCSKDWKISEIELYIVHRETRAFRVEAFPHSPTYYFSPESREPHTRVAQKAAACPIGMELDTALSAAFGANENLWGTRRKLRLLTRTEPRQMGYARSSRDASSLGADLACFSNIE